MAGNSSERCISGGGVLRRLSNEGVIGCEMGVVNKDTDPAEADSGSEMIDSALDECFEDTIWSLRIDISTLASISRRQELFGVCDTTLTSELVSEPLCIFLEIRLVQKLMFKQDLLLEGSRILGFDICQARRYSSFVSLQVIISHLQFPQLNFDFLVFLP